MPLEVAALRGAGQRRHRSVQGVRLRHLMDACRESGVELGALDRQVLTWLAGWEDHTAQVVIGLIRRAHAAGIQAATSEDGG